MTPDEWAAVKAVVMAYIDGEAADPWDLDVAEDVLGIELDPVAA